jgi:predicted aspartyl protease
MLQLGGTDFTIGRSRFQDSAPWSVDPTAKIYVKITPHHLDDMVLFALLDTGAPWSLLDSEIADALHLFDGEENPTTTVQTWRGRVTGRLERIRVRLHADEGNSLDVEATFLVVPEWRGNFLGYGGLLQHIRFAVDATNNLFYFGRD